MPTTLVTAAAATPLSVSEVKDHLRVDHATQDTLIETYLKAAISEFEDLTGRALISSTWEYTLDHFPAYSFKLPKGNLVSVTSVKYTEEGQSEATFSNTNYAVDTKSDPGRITLNDGIYWPVVTLIPASGFVVRFVAGWANAAAVPADIKAALLFKCQLLYDGSTRATTNAVAEIAMRRLDEVFRQTVDRWRTWKPLD